MVSKPRELLWIIAYVFVMHVFFQEKKNVMVIRMKWNYYSFFNNLAMKLS